VKIGLQISAREVLAYRYRPDDALKELPDKEQTFVIVINIVSDDDNRRCSISRYVHDVVTRFDYIHGTVVIFFDGKTCSSISLCPL
jgi:hypothetical protein